MPLTGQTNIDEAVVQLQISIAELTALLNSGMVYTDPNYIAVSNFKSKVDIIEKILSLNTAIQLPITDHESRLVALLSSLNTNISNIASNTAAIGALQAAVTAIQAQLPSFELAPTAAVSNGRTIGGAAFRPSVTRPVQVYYSFKISTTLSLASGQTGTVQLLCDAVNPPTTVVAATFGGNTGTLSLGLSNTDAGGGQLTYEVPAGFYCKIVSIGTATFLFSSQQEIVK